MPGTNASVHCVLQVVQKFGLKTKQEVFKAPRERHKAQMLAKRLLGKAPILEMYRSTKGQQDKAKPHEVVKLVQPNHGPHSAVPWVWRDSSWRELWVTIDGFSVEKRVRGEDPDLSNRVFVEENEELPVYTRDKHTTTSFAAEKQGYFAVTMAGYGVVACVALHSATKLKPNDPHPPTRFKYWTQRLVDFGIGTAEDEAMLKRKVYRVWVKSTLHPHNSYALLHCTAFMIRYITSYPVNYSIQPCCKISCSSSCAYYELKRINIKASHRCSTFGLLISIEPLHGTEIPGQMDCTYKHQQLVVCRLKGARLHRGSASRRCKTSCATS